MALSSRNAYLQPEQRERARTLHQALFAMQQAVSQGTTDAQDLIALATSRITCDRLDYLEVMDALTLQPVSRITDRPCRALVAAWYGQTRLIDNVALGPELSWT